MNKFLKDAIADAKAVRETALANAKVALEEAFAPKLQSMLSHKIKEEMEEEPAEEPTEEQPTTPEEKMEARKMKKMANMMSEEDDDEAMVDEPVEDAPVDDMPTDDTSEDDMSDDDMSDENEPVDEDLEEILRELEADIEQPEDDEAHGKVNPAGLPDKESEEDYAGEKDKSMDETEDPEQKEMDEEIDLDEIIKALREEDEQEEEPKEEEPTSKEELEEAYNVIKFLRSKLNEVNLLNAKLLFVNKLFRKGQLTESQKVRVIETFDRAKNVREAKLIYATLAESLTTSKPAAAPKKRMTEGFASAPQKKTNKIISEGNALVNRFKALVEYNNNR